MLKGSTANEIVDELIAGNKRFLAGESNQVPHLSLAKLKEFARTGQLPKAIILCCSDSRAPVEMVFDQDIGDLFVIRVAGNIVAPSLVGSIEFAAATYGVNLVLVMGHTRCGAVTATLQHVETDLEIDSHNLYDIVSRIKPHILSIAQLQGITFDDKLALAVEANVRASMAELSYSSSIIKALVDEGKLLIRGSVLDLDSGEVLFLEHMETAL